MRKLIEELTPTDIVKMPSGADLKMVLESCGFDVAKALVEHVPGCSIYIPKVTSIIALVDRTILELYDTGETVKRIAIVTGKNQAYVHHVLREAHR